MPHRPTPTKQDPKDTLERGRAMELLLLAGHWACGHEEWQTGPCVNRDYFKVSVLSALPAFSLALI